MRFSIFAAFLSLAILAKAGNNPDDPNGSLFYLVKPACNSYRCQVKVQPGAVLPIEWLNPVKGKIDIFFNPEDDQKGLQRYTIAKNIGAHNNKNKCNADGQNGCGAFDWTVPNNVKPGNYSVEIHSLKQKKVHGYSDIVTVIAGKRKRSEPEEVKKDDKSTKKPKHVKDETKQHKHHKNATESALHHHKHKNATEPVKHHKHKNATETAKHHHKGKTAHSKHHHHKNATHSAKHEHKKHNSTTKGEKEKGKKHTKNAEKNKTSEHKRMVQTALY
jgi:hypothetical protein